LVSAAIAWFAIALQYYLSVTKPGAEVLGATVRYFSYFTILSKILVALALTLPWLAPGSRLGAFLMRPSVRTAIAGYIIIVSAVYYLVLRKLWNPEGLQYLADAIEHCIVPALYLIDWLVFVPKGTVSARSIPSWLLYPLGYGAYSLVRGAATGFYPYPFLEVAQLGYERVLLNMGVLTAIFAVLGLIMVGIDRLLGAGEARKAG
jgi:hypothetical protein